MLSVQDILDNKARGGGSLHSLPPDAPVTDVVRLMAEKHIGSVVILDGERMVGLITLRQLVNALHKLGNGLLAARAADVMNREPLVASPGYSADELRRAMADSKATHMPVVDDGRVVGLLSFHDVARAELSQTSFENDLLKKYIKNWPE